jgi:ABC-type transport system substrate-binding protein
MATLTQIFSAEPLLSLGIDGRAVPALADSWEWQDEGRTLRLHIRPNVKLHNGTPLTASIIVAILQRGLAAIREQATYEGGLQYVQRIESPDESTVLLRLSRPDAFLFSALNETVIVDEKNPNIGTGPFRITETEPHVKAERFDGYYQGLPGIEGLEIKPYDTPRSALAAMMRGEIDMLQEVARESVEFLEGASHIQTYTSLRPYYIPLVFNVRHPVLGRADVRRALNQAIDREEIVREAMGGHGQVAEDPIWPHHWAYSAAAARHSYNPDAARLRLDAAGLPIRRSAPGSNRMDARFRITCVYWSEDPGFERIALLVQRQLAAVGVDVVLQPAVMTDIGQRIDTGAFEMYLFRLLGGRSFEWTYRFWRSGENSLQDSGYSGADSVLDRIRAASSDAETRSAVADLQQKFYEDAPAAFLAWIEATRAVDGRFDVGPQDSGDIFANVWSWRPAVSRSAAR